MKMAKIIMYLTINNVTALCNKIINDNIDILWWNFKRCCISFSLQWWLSSIVKRDDKCVCEMKWYMINDICNMWHHKILYVWNILIWYNLWLAMSMYFLYFQTMPYYENNVTIGVKWNMISVCVWKWNMKWKHGRHVVALGVMSAK